MKLLSSLSYIFLPVDSGNWFMAWLTMYFFCMQGEFMTDFLATCWHPNVLL